MFNNLVQRIINIYTLSRHLLQLSEPSNFDVAAAMTLIGLPAQQKNLLFTMYSYIKHTVLVISNPESGLVLLLVVLSIIAVIAFLILIILFKDNKIFLKQKVKTLIIPKYDFEAIMKIISSGSFIYYPKYDIVEIDDELSKLILQNEKTLSYDDFVKHIENTDREVFSQTINPIKQTSRLLDCLELRFTANAQGSSVRCMLINTKKDILGKCEAIHGYILTSSNKISNKIINEIDDLEFAMQKQIGMGYWQYDHERKTVFLSRSAANLYFDKDIQMEIYLDDFMQILSANSVTDLMFNISASSDEVSLDYELMQNFTSSCGKNKNINVICRSYFKNNELKKITALSFVSPYNSLKHNNGYQIN